MILEAIQLFHWLLVAFPSLFILLGGSPRYYELIVATFIFVSAHWFFFKGECVLSYFYKKIRDCKYKLGDTKETADMKVHGSRVPQSILTFLGSVSLLKMSLYMKYNIPIFVLLESISIFNSYIPYSNALLVPLSCYFLRDSQYLVPGILLILFSSIIIKHLDQVPCGNEKENSSKKLFHS